MSLESTLTKLIAAIEDNTAAMRELANTPEPVSTTTEPPKPKSETAEPAPEPSPEPAPAAETEEAKASGIDKKALTAKIIELAKTKGRDAASKLLAEYGATKVPEVKEEDFDAVFAKADAILGA